jgi:DNA-binding NtrC family response regulator
MTRSVLIVEDEPLIRSLCAEVFDDAGFTVVEADDGDAALAILGSDVAIDAIVTDILMPGTVDGLALRRKVEQTWPNVKVVVTSGHMAVERAELSENHVFVPKPYQFLEMVRQVETLLAL